MPGRGRGRSGGGATGSGRGCGQRRRRGGNRNAACHWHPSCRRRWLGHGGGGPRRCSQAGPRATIYSVSCAGAGTCSAGGSNADSSHNDQAFVVSEVNGTWRKAREVRGTAALNQGGDALTISVSCAAAGTCSAGGRYTDSSGHGQAFVVKQVNGIWGKARKVPGTAALNQGGFAAANSVSCAPAGTCSAGGSYKDSTGHFLAFVVNKR